MFSDAINKIETKDVWELMLHDDVSRPQSQFRKQGGSSMRWNQGQVPGFQELCGQLLGSQPRLWEIRAWEWHLTGSELFLKGKNIHQPAEARLYPVPGYLLTLPSYLFKCTFQYYPRPFSFWILLCHLYSHRFTKGVKKHCNK
jgi:hypothetical protein